MGQVNRVDSCKLAVDAGGGAGAGSVAASDAFFPFADGPQVLLDAGVRAIVQPGGSVRDERSIAAARAAGVTMYFTGTRGTSSTDEALAYLAFPAVRGFAVFAILMAVLGTIETAARSGRGAYWMTIFERETRVRGMAYMRSARNIGYTLGAAAGGFALAIGTREAIIAVPLLTAFLLLVDAVLISRMPDVRRGVEAGVDEADATPDGAPADAAPGAARDTARTTGGVPGMRNAGFVVLGLANGILGTNQVLLNVVVPLWLVERTDAPHTLLAWLFGTNTVMAVLLQVRAARGADTVAGCLRLIRWCGWSFVLSCLLIAVTHDTVGWVSIALIWAGHIAITGAELWQSASAWGFMSELSDPDRLGEYQGVFQLGWQAASIVAPGLFTWLAMEHGGVGWAVIAAIAVVAAAVSHPAARAAEVRLTRAPIATPGLGSPEVTLAD
jgi:hypothetical protein